MPKISLNSAEGSGRFRRIKLRCELNSPRVIETKLRKTSKMTTKSPHQILRLAGLTLGIALFAGTIVSAVAGELPTGKGGAILLMKPQLPASAPAPSSMSCPTCKDQYVIRRDVTARGVKPTTQILQRHLCGGCDTRLTTVGAGKARQAVPVHNCTMNTGSDFACCKSSL